MRLFQKLSLAIVTLMSLVILTPGLALADCNSCGTGSAKAAIECGSNSAASGDCSTQPTGNLNKTISSIVNVLSVIVGVTAVIMIIVAGLRYITSAGNPEGAKSARNTILYSVVGLVVVALAQIIVHFVISKVK